MILLLLAYLLFLLLHIHPSSNQEEVLSKQNTTMINGVFVGFVFLSHFMQYANVGSLYTLFFQCFNQLSVTTFLFFSGYGLATSYVVKGKEYMTHFPKQRIGKFYLSFVCALFCFIAINLLLNHSYSLPTILLSFIGWTSIGNSNWYVFVMLCLYIFFYITFQLPTSNKKKCISLWSICLLFIILLMISGKPNYWYNTLLVFPMGVSFVFYKEYLFALLEKYKALLFVCFIGAGLLRDIVMMYELHAILFVLLIVYGMKHIHIQSSFFSFLGNHIFSIYILQRIVFILLHNIMWPTSILYFLLSALITIMVALCFDDVVNKLVRRIL